MKRNSKICFLPLPNNIQERAAPAALSNPSAARYSQPYPLRTHRTIKNISGNSLRLFFQPHIASISSVPWASFLCGFLSGICGCVAKWFLWIFPFMSAKLLLPSWYFICFFLLFPLYPFLWALGVEIHVSKRQTCGFRHGCRWMPTQQLWAAHKHLATRGKKVCLS